MTLEEHFGLALPPFPKAVSEASLLRHSALQQVLIDLCLLYKEVTDRELGTCVDPFTFEVHGSLIRLLRLCLPPLEWNLSTDAIRAHLRRLPKDSF